MTGLRLPRTRGDGPAESLVRPPEPRASPHTRGWTRHARPLLGTGHGFPAHAGMDPWSPCSARCGAWLPRTRGDGPETCGVTDGNVPASPHTRGWTRMCLSVTTRRPGFPAHAGMDPQQHSTAGRDTRLPRTRGDGPTAVGLPAVADMASPHTRGWTHDPAGRTASPGGFPAHAGMDPAQRAGDGLGAGLPRTRGDGPCSRSALAVASAASPHTRGWTRPARPRPAHRPGFPAHAGMDPPVRGPPAGWPRLPRTRGDGPQLPRGRAGGVRASPHTRGWTLLPSPTVPPSAKNGPDSLRGPDVRPKGRGRSCRAWAVHRVTPRLGIGSGSMPAARVTASLMLGCLSLSMVVTRGAPGRGRRCGRGSSPSSGGAGPRCRPSAARGRPCVTRVRRSARSQPRTAGAPS